MYRWYGEEIECGDHLAMIPQKGEPPWIGVTTANHAAQISGHGPFRDGKAELLQFRVDLGEPQSGFSFARRPIQSLTSCVILGRPPRGRDRQRQ